MTHADGGRIDEVVARVEQAHREVPALVADEERRPVAARGQEGVAPARRGALEHVVGDELRAGPAVGIAWMTPVAP